MLYYRKEEGAKDDTIQEREQETIQPLPASSTDTVPENGKERTGSGSTTNVDGPQSTDRGPTPGRPTIKGGDERDSNVRPHRSKRVTKNQFTIEQNEAITQGEVARFNDNYNAIKLLKEDKSFYTKEELSTLSRYTGCIDSESNSKVTVRFGSKARINKTSHW
ncbi:hypothetical protein ACLHDG_13835 [Sulfurovum sp. CS9]|uniref:hypothetical protein n=1 Tax=Sulfurovum sp. CS9 TaxID=3391146 RepID=UPI0039E9DE9F